MCVLLNPCGLGRSCPRWHLHTNTGDRTACYEGMRLFQQHWCTKAGKQTFGHLIYTCLQDPHQGFDLPLGKTITKASGEPQLWRRGRQGAAAGWAPQPNTSRSLLKGEKSTKAHSAAVKCLNHFHRPHLVTLGAQTLSRRRTQNIFLCYAENISVDTVQPSPPLGLAPTVSFQLLKICCFLYSICSDSKNVKKKQSHRPVCSRAPCIAHLGALLSSQDWTR